MRRVAAVMLSLFLGLSASALAHEVTHKGTVVSLKTAKYAQPGGESREVQELEVSVVDPKTKKTATRVFTIADSTRVMRGAAKATLSELGLKKGDVVEVVVDHDKPGDVAVAVRVPAT